MAIKTKIVFCGTHPCQYNGYSKIVYELCKGIVEYEDIELYLFGFQNFHKNEVHMKERTIPKVKEVYDVHEREKELDLKGTKGFGESIIVEYLNKVDPDIVIVYNDLVIVTSMLNKIKKDIPNHRFKIVPYLDLVYKNEKNNMIKYISDNVDGCIMFTEHWKKIVLEQGFAKECKVIEHGFNPNITYPIQKNIARKFYNINEKDFVILNLNRNQPRKRWDICIMAFVKFISKRLDQPIKLVIATALNGGWDLIDIMKSECRKNKISLEDLKTHLVIIQNPQQVSDREINVLYNTADIGLNTCDGEGFGLCNFEQAGLGIPQIVPKLGGFKDFLNTYSSVMVTPKWTYYCDHSRDFVSGEAEVCEVDDFVKAMEFYYDNEKTRESHGDKSRKNILKNYKWTDLSKKLYETVIYFTKDIVKIREENEANIDTSILLKDTCDIDISTLIKEHLSISENMVTVKNSGEIEKETEEDVFIIEGGC
jgi:glycosyltransferase involved in cell wall biosynthesis